MDRVHDGSGGKNSTPQSFTKIYGSALSDLFEGNSAQNEIHGYQGNDELSGLEGDDLLYGGDGDDLLQGGDGDDLLEGGAGNDILYGGAGHDAIFGQDGNDQLFGGLGNDELGGGAGADIFVPGGGEDTTDASADVSVVGSSMGVADLGPNNAPVSVPYWVDVANSDPDYANNVTVENKWSGDFSPRLESLPLGTELKDPLTGQPTGIRILPPGFKQTDQHQVQAVRPGTGVYVGTIQIGAPYIEDPRPWNNRAQREDEIRPNRDPVKPAQPKLKTVNVSGTKTGNAGVKVFSSSGVSTDGSKIAFVSQATDYDTTPITGQPMHVFYGDPVMVDTTPNGSASGDGTAMDLSLSADGRYVAFRSGATNLVEGLTDGNQADDVFVRDMQTGVTRLVSRNLAGGGPGNAVSGQPWISGDGRFVAFLSRATDLVAGVPAGTTTWQVYRADLQTGAIELVSRNVAGTGPADGDAGMVQINHDGRYVVWSSKATDQVGGIADTNGMSDLFVRDMAAGTTALVSVNHQRTAAANGAVHFAFDVTPDGAWIAYASDAGDLVDLPDPTVGSRDVFVYNVLLGTNRLASVSSDGTSAGNGHSTLPVLSSDGRFVAFQSEASNLVAGTGTSSLRVYVRDLTQNATEFGAPHSAGTGPAATSQNPSLSGDGRYLAFTSDAADVVADFVDGNGTGQDVYVRDRQTGKTTLMSVSRLGTASANGDSRFPLLSRNGQVVHFQSKATDLVWGITDQNADYDIFSSTAHVGGESTALRYTLPAGGPNQVTLRRNGADVQLVRDADGQVLASRPLADTTIAIVTGADATDDQLTVDLAAGGFFNLAGGIVFDAGAGGQDRLVQRGNLTAARYHATGPNAGYVSAESGSLLVTSYTGLESIVDEAVARVRSFTSWLSGGGQVRLRDDGNPTNGRMVFDSADTGAFTPVDFRIPTQGLMLEGGSGNDTLTIASLDLLDPFYILTLTGGGGNDVLDAWAATRSVTLDGGPGDNRLRGGTGSDQYNVTPLGRTVIEDAGGGGDRLSFANAFAPVTVDLDLQATDQTIDGGGSVLQINGQIENFTGSKFADAVWVAPLADARDISPAASGSDPTVFDRMRVRTHDPAATNNVVVVQVPGFNWIMHTFPRVSMWLPPVAADDSVAAQIGTPLTIPVLANDADPESDPFAVSAVTQPAHGTAVLNGDGTVTYTPVAGYFGEDQFTYTVQDPLGGSSTAKVYVNVNRAPDAVDDAVTNTIVTVDVLANDTDPDGDPLSVTGITQPADGTAVLNAGGTITYTPPAGFQGTALIPYTISDGQGGTDTATLTVTVRPVNDPPTFTAGANQTLDANAGPQTVANWATNISPGPADEAGQTVQFFTATDTPEMFAVLPAIAANGTLTYTPAANIGGTAVVLVQAVDDGGTADGGRDASDVAAFTITVVAPGDLELTGFSTTAGMLGQLELTYEVRGAAVPAFEIGFYTSADARYDAADTERGPRINVTDAALRTVGSHTITVSGADYEAFLLDPAVRFFLALADAGQAIPAETDETNNDLNFMGVYHRPASPAPLLIRGGDDTDRRVDDPNDTIELTGGAALNVTSRFTAAPLAIPWADVASIRVVTAGGADTIRGEAAAVALLHAEGGGGNDTLVFLGGGAVCDLTGSVLPRVRGVEMLDIQGNGANRLVLRQAHVLEADGGVLSVRAGSDDTVDFGGGWTLAAPQFVGGEFFNVLNQTGASLRLTGPHPWRNPVNAFDVNNADGVTALDVLLVINRINAQGPGALPVAPPAADCPPFWFDVSGDDQLTALDVLTVINWINGQTAAGGGEGEATRTPSGELGGTIPWAIDDGRDSAVLRAGRDEDRSNGGRNNFPVFFGVALLGTPSSVGAGRHTMPLLGVPSSATLPVTEGLLQAEVNSALVASRIPPEANPAATNVGQMLKTVTHAVGADGIIDITKAGRQKRSLAVSVGLPR